MSTPINLLNEIREIGIDELYSIYIPKERIAAIKLSKKKLSVIKKSLREITKSIEKQYDGRKSYEATKETRELAPYKPIDTLISEIEIALEELLVASENQRPLPSKIVIGSILMDYGSNVHKVITKRQLLQIRQEEALTQRDNLIRRLNEIKIAAKENIKKIHPFPDIQWWVELFLRIVICGTPFICYFLGKFMNMWGKINNTLANIFIFILVIGIIWAILGLFSWGTIQAKRKQAIIDGKQTFLETKGQLSELKKTYIDLGNQLKNLPEDSN